MAPSRFAQSLPLVSFEYVIVTRKLKHSTPPEPPTGDQASAEEVIDRVLHLLAQAVVADVMAQPSAAENTISTSGADEEGD